MDYAPVCANALRVKCIARLHGAQSHDQTFNVAADYIPNHWQVTARKQKSFFTTKAFTQYSHDKNLKVKVVTAHGIEKLPSTGVGMDTSADMVVAME